MSFVFSRLCPAVRDCIEAEADGRTNPPLSGHSGEPEAHVARPRGNVLGVRETELTVREGARDGVLDFLVAHAAVQSQGEDVDRGILRFHPLDVLRSDDEVQGRNGFGLAHFITVAVLEHLDDGSSRCTHRVGQEEDAAVQRAGLLVGNGCSSHLVVPIGLACGAEVVRPHIAVLEQADEAATAGIRRDISGAEEDSDDHLGVSIRSLVFHYAVFAYVLGHGGDGRDQAGGEEAVDCGADEHLLV